MSRHRPLVKSFRVLGIDPGYGRFGYGVVERQGTSSVCLTYGVIETPSSMDIGDRLLNISREVRQIIKKYNPAVIGLERLLFQKNVKTAVSVAEARGVLLTIAAEAEVPVIEISPNEVKQSLTNYGAAPKKQLQAMVKVVLKLSEIPEPDDAADALAIALVAEQKYSSPL